MHALALSLLLATAIDARSLESLLDDVMQREMKQRRIPGAAFILVQNGRVVLAKGYGLANVDDRVAVDPAKTIFPIASITKVFTATAVVQLADRGALDLNADVNRYLRQVRVPDTYKQPVTAAHLLTHSAGFDELRGRLVQPGEKVQPLDRFLSTRLIRIRPPGELTAYSSFGAALAGQLVEDVSGMPFERYLACNLFTPLGMHRTQITLPDALLADAAIGYEADEAQKLVAVPWERYHTPPASSISSTASDMGRFMMAMLAEGKGILSARAANEMLRQQRTMHPRVPGFGHGWQMSDTNGRRIVEHGGDIGGFSSLMTLLPDDESGFFLVNHREGIDLREPVRKAILDRFFPRETPLPVPVANQADAAKHKRLEGTYRGSIWCHTCEFDPDRVRDVKVTANDDGTLTIWDSKWIEVAPLFFRGADGKGRVGFHEDAQGNITAMTGGSWLTFERLRTIAR